MGLTMGQRKALTREMAARYRGASRPQKKAMLDEFVELHGCTRHHAGWLLRMWGKTVFERRDGELVKIVVGQRLPRRRSSRVYDEQVGAALKKVWYLFGCLCGKRLVAVLRTQLPVLEKFGELDLDPDTRQKLQRISAARSRLSVRAALQEWSPILCYCPHPTTPLSFPWTAQTAARFPGPDAASRRAALWVKSAHLRAADPNALPQAAHRVMSGKRAPARLDGQAGTSHMILAHLWSQRRP